jgi:DNA polymerase-1
VRIAVAATTEGAGVLQELTDDGRPVGAPTAVADLAAAVARREAGDAPRWVWADGSLIYPELLERSVRLGRCHDLALTEALLLAHEGRFGESRWLGAAWARLRGDPVPDEPHRDPRDAPPTLFEGAADDDAGDGGDLLTPVREVYADQMRRIAATAHPGRFLLMAAAESAGGLAAAEMGHEGLPWSADAHDGVLTEALGPRPVGGARPPRLAELAEAITVAFERTVNPDSPAQVLKAFSAAGVSVRTTRSAELRGVDHPAVPFLLEYKELARLHAAHGWAWREAWVRGGRFRPEYVVGGVVSGRWATRGGGALQIPKAMRRAVVADPGWALVVADAGQVEPRVLAALAGDRGLADAAAAGDLYAALAPSFDGDRARAKIAVLAAMYGQTGGEAAPLLALMRTRFPKAFGYVEAAARAGERGQVVSSHLGRTCPPPSDGWRETVAGPADPENDTDGGSGAAARSRGRFTRNFVVQATAAEWALVLLAALRRRLAERGPRPDAPRLVFYQHDEVMVHTPEALADDVVSEVRAAAEEARELVFGETPVRFPLDISVVGCYADAK